jgi:hypothetical protein
VVIDVCVLHIQRHSREGLCIVSSHGVSFEMLKVCLRPHVNYYKEGKDSSGDFNTIIKKVRICPGRDADFYPVRIELLLLLVRYQTR